MSANTTEDAVEATLKEMASRILVAGEFFINNHQQRLLTPFAGFGPSKPGEYPHLRTGQGKAGVTKDCNSAQEVIDAGMVLRIGQRSMSWYMVHLETGLGRAGFLKTADDLRASVQAIVGIGSGLKVE